MVLYCTVSKIRWLIGWKLHFFPTLSYLVPPRHVPLEFRGEANRDETRVMGLLSGESCMILTSTVFDWSTHVTDRQTDGRTTAYTRHSVYAVACNKMLVKQHQSVREETQQTARTCCCHPVISKWRKSCFWVVVVRQHIIKSILCQKSTHMWEIVQCVCMHTALNKFNIEQSKTTVSNWDGCIMRASQKRMCSCIH